MAALPERQPRQGGLTKTSYLGQTVLPPERVGDPVGYGLRFPEVIEVCFGITEVAPGNFVLIVVSVRGQPFEKCHPGFVMRGVQGDRPAQMERLVREDAVTRRNSDHRREEMRLCT